MMASAVPPYDVRVTPGDVYATAKRVMDAADMMYEAQGNLAAALAAHGGMAGNDPHGHASRGDMMHEFHAWVGLSDSTEEDDLAKVRVVVDDLRAMVEESSWHHASFEVKNLNGQYFFMADGFVNRRRDEGERLDLFLDTISRRLPGSWGLVYERDDEMPDPPGPNGFRVRMLARGKIFERADPFLSPCNPVMAPA